MQGCVPAGRRRRYKRGALLSDAKKVLATFLIERPCLHASTADDLAQGFLRVSSYPV